MLWYKRNKTLYDTTPSSFSFQERALYWSLLMYLKRPVTYYFSGASGDTEPLYLLKGLPCAEEISSRIEHFFFYVGVKKQKHQAQFFHNSILNWSLGADGFSSFYFCSLTVFICFCFPPLLVRVCCRVRVAAGRSETRCCGMTLVVRGASERRLAPTVRCSVSSRLPGAHS